MPLFHVRPDRSAPRRYPTAPPSTPLGKSDIIPPAPPETQIRPPRPGEPRRENSAPGSLNLGTAQKNFLRKGDGTRASSPAPGSRPSSRPASRLRASSPAPATAAFAPDLQASMKNMEDFLKHADELLERTKAAQAEVATAGEWNLPEWMQQIRDPPLVTPAQMRAGMAPAAVRVPETPAATPATAAAVSAARTPAATAPFPRSSATPGAIPGLFVSEDFSSSMRSVMDTVRRVAKATGSEQLRAQAEALDVEMTREAEVGEAPPRDSWYPHATAEAAIMNAPLARADAEALAESLRRAADAAEADARTRAHIESKKSRAGRPGGEAKSLRERLRSITDSVAKLRGDGGRGESARRRGSRAYFYRDDDEDDRETDYAISDDDAGGAGSRGMDVRRMDAEVQAAMSRSNSRAAVTDRYGPLPNRVESSARVRSAPASRLGTRVGSRRDLSSRALHSNVTFERLAAGQAGGHASGATDGWWSRPGSRAGRNRTNSNAYADAGVGEYNVREDFENVDPDDGYDDDHEDAPIVNKESIAAAVAAAMAVANSMRPPPPPPMSDEEREKLNAENGRLRETVRRLRSELGVANRLVMGYHAQLMTGGSRAPRFGNDPETRRGDETTRAPSFKHRAPRAPFAAAPAADENARAAWDDTTSLRPPRGGGAFAREVAGSNPSGGGARSAWRAERKRRTAELETLQAERQIAEEAAAMDERVALDANEQLREEIGELREMMREVMRRQQTPRGLRPKPPVHPASPRGTNATHESPTRSHPTVAHSIHGERFRGLYDETRGDETGDKVTHGVRDPSPEPPDAEAEEPTSVRTSPYRSTG